MIRKAVVLARGLGTRMQKNVQGIHLEEGARRAADEGAKAMMPIGGRPFLDYGIQELLDAGLTEVCLVIAPDNVTIKEYYQAINDRSHTFQITFAIQERPLGTADAVRAARCFAGEDEFIMVNCDNLYSVAALRLLCEQPSGSCYAVGYERNAMAAKGNIEPDRVSRFAVVQVDNEWNLTRVIEKPDNPDAYAMGGKVYLSMNLFRFTPDIFTACAAIDLHPVRQEYEITAAVQYLIDHNLCPCRVIPCSEGVYDLTSRRDIVSLQQMLAQRLLRFS